MACSAWSSEKMKMMLGFSAEKELAARARNKGKSRFFIIHLGQQS